MTKTNLSLAACALLLASCNSTPKQSAQPPVVDAATTQAPQQQDLVMHELPQNASYQSGSATTTKTVENPKHVVGHSSTSHTATAPTTSGNSKKKGWSKTAKGAVIGGVAGAVGGAVIDKKNPVAGAVIGAAVGAGTGAIIGNGMDKKDGRH